jgi:hypothetical protein
MSRLVFLIVAAIVVWLNAACTQDAKEMSLQTASVPKDTIIFELENLPDNSLSGRKNRVTPSYYQTLQHRQRNNYCKIRIHNYTNHDYQVDTVDSLINYVNADYHSISEDAWLFPRICEWSVHAGYKSHSISRNTTTCLYLPYQVSDIDTAAIHLDFYQLENEKVKKGYKKGQALYVTLASYAIKLIGVDQYESQ